MQWNIIATIGPSLNDITFFYFQIIFWAIDNFGKMFKVELSKKIDKNRKKSRKKNENKPKAIFICPITVKISQKFKCCSKHRQLNDCVITRCGLFKWPQMTSKFEAQMALWPWRINSDRINLSLNDWFFLKWFEIFYFHSIEFQVMYSTIFDTNFENWNRTFINRLKKGSGRSISRLNSGIKNLYFFWYFYFFSKNWKWFRIRSWNFRRIFEIVWVASICVGVSLKNHSLRISFTLVILIYKIKDIYLISPKPTQFKPP